MKSRNEEGGDFTGKMDLSLIKTLLPVLILLISGLIVAVQKRETYVVVVKLQAQMEQAEKNISSLWTYTNSLRNKLNGH
jgi:hypothetical protein